LRSANCIFHAYDLLRDNDQDVPTYDFAYKTLHSLGFVTNQAAAVMPNIDKVIKFADSWEQKRLDQPFGTDGLVVKVNDRQLYGQLGVVGKAPRGAIAIKYPAEEATTIVKDIIISVGRTGTATPWQFCIR
jgi:DNA ligase (NAD+)